MWFAHSVYAIGATPSGNPGCPDFAFSTASADNILIVSTVSCSILFNLISSSIMYVNFTCLKFIYNRYMSYNKYRILCSILQEYIVMI